MSLLSRIYNKEPLEEASKLLAPLELSKEEEHVVIARIKKLARDPEVKFANALELTHQGYEQQEWERQHSIGDLVRPTPPDKEAWEQYEKFIQLAVSLLAKYRGIQGDWRTDRFDTVPTHHRASMGSMAAARVAETVSVEWNSLKDLGILLENVEEGASTFKNNGVYNNDINVVASTIARDAEAKGLIVAEGEQTERSLTLHVYDADANEIDSILLQLK